MENYIKIFLRTNRLKQVDIARYLGISEPFMSQVANGSANLSRENLEKLLDNDQGWDISMLPSSQNGESGDIVMNRDNHQGYMSKELNKMLDCLNESLKQNSRLIGIIEKMNKQ